jgi:DNA (cytosine-5)-methyltransferase 1
MQFPDFTPRYIVVDFLCGAGGFTEGAEQARDENGNPLVWVAVGLNHDKDALRSHEINHPLTVHFYEDVRDRGVIEKIRQVLVEAKKRFPNAKIVCHFSLECTNFSNAKGGAERDADSRALADCLYRYEEVPGSGKWLWDGYVQRLNPDYVTIENVREFMAWGPLINGKPEHRTKGRDYLRWVSDIESLGYRYDARLLNSADYGEHTSRIRLFGCFARTGLPIVFPEPTHAKDPEKSGALFGKKLKKWKPVRPCLDLDDKGENIFSRKIPLKEKTLERIEAGLWKHVAGGKPEFLSKYYSGHPESKNLTIDGPSGALTCVDSHALVQAEPFVMQSNGGLPSAKSYPVDSTGRVVTTSDNQALVSPEPFLAQIFATSSVADGTYKTDRPARTVTTADGTALVSPEPFVMNYYGGSPEHRNKSLDEPCLTVRTNNCQSLVTPEPFISESQWGGQSHSLDKPAPTILAAHGKAPQNLVTPEPFCMKYHGTGENTFASDEVCSTLTTRDRVSVVQSDWLLTNNHHNEGHGLDRPAPTLLTGNHHYLMSTHFGRELHGLEKPSPTITADRHWNYLFTTETGEVAILVYETDSPATRRIKAFMARFGIAAIYMRMLKVRELKRIQGFPDDYVLLGSQEKQKKFIGNSVTPKIPKAWFEAKVRALAA